MKWLGFVITPILIILGGVIPFSLWYQVFKNKLHLDDITVRLPWGFYYNEYKK
jgi:Trk-type K+ transport system membrane component